MNGSRFLTRKLLPAWRNRAWRIAKWNSGLRSSVFRPRSSSAFRNSLFAILCALLFAPCALPPNAAAAASIKLIWTDTSNNETGFKVERALGTNGSFSVIATAGANAQSYIDSTIVAGKTYCYRVRAYNSAGDSSPSNQACANVTESSTSTVNLDTSGGGSTSNSTSSSGTGSTGAFTSTSQSGAGWANYRFMVKMRSSDDDAIGVMFRYKDNDNYYRFSWHQQDGYRRLEKRVNGAFRTLVEDAVRYVAGRTYQLEIIAQGTSLKVKIDGAEIFSVFDSSHGSGTVALYSWYNQGSIFDDVFVEDLSNGATLLWDDFNNGNAAGWIIVDEGKAEGPSVWSATSGAFVQSSNVGSTTAGRLGTYALYQY